MAVRVLLFAGMAERAGTRSLVIDCHRGDTVRSVCERLIERLPALREFVPTLLYALGEEYVSEDDPVEDGATLALIPPVSGG